MGIEELNVKDLLELRRRVMKRIDELRSELSMLESMLKVLDSLIKAQSITTADKVQPRVNSVSLTAPNGEELAKLTYDDNGVVIEFSKPISEQPPLSKFFVERVLNGFRDEDERLVNDGELDESMAFNYSIEKNSEGLVTRIVIKNYRDQRRLRRIIDAMKWTVSRLSEGHGS